MIRRPLGDGDLLIAQRDHALHAGRLAALLAEVPEPRASVLAAVSLHDAGWTILDEAPRLDAEGRPASVFDLPAAVTVVAWRRSVAIARASGPVEALLVSRHFASFSEASRAEQESYQTAWRAGLPAASEERGLKVLKLCDALSLRLLFGESTPVSLPDGMTLDGDRLHPWPFRTDRIQDQVVGRLLPRRRWQSPEALAEAYGSAPLQNLPLPLQKKMNVVRP